MNTALATATLATAAFGAVAFVAYWFGVRHAEQETRAWKRRAYGNEQIAGILADANSELKAELRSLRSGRDLSNREARQIEQIIREAG